MVERMRNILHSSSSVGNFKFKLKVTVTVTAVDVKESWTRVTRVTWYKRSRTRRIMTRIMPVPVVTVIRLGLGVQPEPEPERGDSESINLNVAVESDIQVAPKKYCK
jgi:hypothetical protein